jgi:protein-S-isoprenylcysteine O-methyltransferase Ste14
MPFLIAKVAKRIVWLRGTKFYDLIAAAPAIALYSFCGVQMVPILIQQIMLAALFIRTDPSVLPVPFVLSLVSRAVVLAFLTILVVLFVVRCVPKYSAPGLYPRFAALAGASLSFGIVLLPPRELSDALYLTSLLLVVSGTAFAIWAVLGLGRSISILPQARQLVTQGPYSIMRHPLYLGEMVATTGIALQYMAPWSLLLLGLECMFQLLRIKNEERAMLEVFPEYADYMARTARLVPGVY